MDLAISPGRGRPDARMKQLAIHFETRVLARDMEHRPLPACELSVEIRRRSIGGDGSADVQQAHRHVQRIYDDELALQEAERDQRTCVEETAGRNTAPHSLRYCSDHLAKTSEDSLRGTWCRFPLNHLGGGLGGKGGLRDGAKAHDANVTYRNRHKHQGSNSG